MHNSLGACKMRLILFCFLLCLGCAHAADWAKETGWKLTPDRDGVWRVLPENVPGQRHETICTSSACTRAGSIPTPVGSPRGTINPLATIPKSSIAAGALALGGRVIPWLSIGMGLYDWYKAAGIDYDEASGFSSSSSDLVYLGVVSRNTNKAYRMQETGLSALASMCSQTGPGWMAAGPPAYYEADGKHHSTCGYWLNGQWYMTDAVVSVSGQRVCVSPTYEVSNPVNGVCSGQTQPIDPQTAQQKLSDAPVTADVIKRALQEVLDAGGRVSDTGQHTVSGPSSVPGSTSIQTTTKPDGTTSISTTTTTYNITYNNNTINVTTTEKTTNPDGTTTETTTEPKQTECEKNPNSVGCADLTNNEKGEPGWQTKNVVYQVDSLGLPAACPAPWTGVVRAWSLSMSWQPACDQAPAIRAGVLALASLSALLLIITTVRN